MNISPVRSFGTLRTLCKTEQSPFKKLPFPIKQSYHTSSPLPKKGWKLKTGVLLTGVTIGTSFYIYNEIKKGEKLEIVDPDANLLEYPTNREYPFDKNCQVTIGDLHGNALKLLYTLIRQNIADLNESDYLKFAEIYLKDVEQLTKEDLNAFDAILDRITFRTPPKGAMFHLIGDDVSDRGSNDWFTLKLFEKMVQNQVPFEVIFSNHGFEFVDVYENGIMDHTSYLEKYQQACSLTNLRILLKKGLVSIEELDHLVKNVYQPFLRAVSGTYLKWPMILSPFFEDRFTLFTHAPVGLKTIESLAKSKNFEVAFEDQSVLDLAQTIQSINVIFKNYAQENQISKTFLPEIASKTRAVDIPLEFPMKRCIWSRGHQEKDLPEEFHNGYRLFYVYGHDGNGKIDARFQSFATNLDNKLGKGKGNDKQKYSVLYSHETAIAHKV